MECLGDTIDQSRNPLAIVIASGVDKISPPLYIIAKSYDNRTTKTLTLLLLQGLRDFCFCSQNILLHAPLRKLGRLSDLRQAQPIAHM